MKQLQEKSLCCGEKIIRYGKKRRQCTKCKKTWSVWKSKRGKKEKRINYQKIIKDLLEHKTATIIAEAQKRKITTATFQKRVSKYLKKFNQKNKYSEIDITKKLIVIADAKVEYINKSWWTWYCIFLRDIKNDEAIICKPYCRKGTEIVKGWQEAFRGLEPSVLVKIQALVCDGHAGLIKVATDNKWLIQRCHFHLIARIQSRRSKWNSSRNKKEGQKIYNLAKIALTTKNQKILISTLKKLLKLKNLTTSPDLKRTLSGFCKHYKYFRTYLDYPKLNLPITTNTAESFNNCIQNLIFRFKGFKTVNSLKNWIEALAKNKKKMKCRPNYQQN